MTFWSSRTIDLINLFSGILWADCVGGGGREGDYWKTLAVAMNVWLCKTDTSASAASSNAPHALCKVRQNCRVHVITQPTATLHKLFVYEIFIAVASGQVSNCLDMTIYRLVALRALCDSEKDKGVHFVCVSTLLCLCLMWPLLWSERDTELQSTHGPGQAGPDPDNFSPRHVGVKCASGQGRAGKVSPWPRSGHRSHQSTPSEAIRDLEPRTPGVSTEESGLFVAAMVSPHDQNKTGIGSGTPSWDHTDQAPVALEDKAFQRRTC